jgi:hypothetical protein
MKASRESAEKRGFVREKGVDCQQKNCGGRGNMAIEGIWRGEPWEWVGELENGGVPLGRGTWPWMPLWPSLPLLGSASIREGGGHRFELPGGKMASQKNRCWQIE